MSSDYPDKIGEYVCMESQCFEARIKFWLYIFYQQRRAKAYKIEGLLLERDLEKSNFILIEINSSSMRLSEHLKVFFET